MAERGKFNLQVPHIQHGHLLMHHRVPNPSRKTAEVWPVDVAQGFPMDLDWGGMEVFAAIFHAQDVLLSMPTQIEALLAEPESLGRTDWAVFNLYCLKLTNTNKMKRLV